jgi:hypothetical protein
MNITMEYSANTLKLGLSFIEQQQFLAMNYAQSFANSQQYQVYDAASID